jgi:hypothetical protein
LNNPAPDARRSTCWNGYSVVKQYTILKLKQSNDNAEFADQPASDINRKSGVRRYGTDAGNDSKQRTGEIFDMVGEQREKGEW